jgi:UDP-N-acetylmuramate--alanine ligase
VYLVGIAGSGMRALADVLLGWGWKISGSDWDVSPVEALSAAGVKLHRGHDARFLPSDVDEVVFSDAVPRDNPEIRRAAEQGIPASSYFEMLGRLSVGRHTVAIAGTHGKSSTTAMAAHLLIHAGLDPTVICGATPMGTTSGGRAGRSGLMLIEACEYRANFLHLRPQHAAILGIEPDHFDCYDTLEQLEGAFRQFAESIPTNGFLLARHDCPSTRRVTAGLSCQVESFGLSADADWSAHALGQEVGRFQFEIRHKDGLFCKTRLQVFGLHNVLNALAAAALAWENGVSAAQIASGLADFPGLHRRLEVLGAYRGKGDSPIFANAKIGTVPSRVTLIDDYAHHPTEISAALAAVRLMFPHSRVWCVFQPHQASRTARLLDELAESLQNADMVMVAEIFRAREGEPRPGEVTAADLARRVAQLGAEVLPGHSAPEIVDALETQLAPGDVLVTLGAGNTEQYRPNLFPAVYFSQQEKRSEHGSHDRL